MKVAYHIPLGQDGFIEIEFSLKFYKESLEKEQIKQALDNAFKLIEKSI